MEARGILCKKTGFFYVTQINLVSNNSRYLFYVINYANKKLFSYKNWAWILGYIKFHVLGLKDAKV